MRKFLSLGSPLLATLALASPAGAVTAYVSPTGTVTSTTCCTSRDAPCDLASAAATAVAGDTVILMDGVYKTQLYVANSGTASDWITFKADDCATPIIEGPGVAPDADNQDAGVSSSTATYVKFIGLVSRGWSTGFGNGWTGSGTTNSNGNWSFEYCLADGNGRTGFTFFSAQGLTLKHSISAHNGSSTLHSWSSGITLYESTGGDLVEGNVSFENMDGQKHTDGSGFIVDETSNDATFVNNIAFRNGGSCLRLTKSTGTKFINNTCYHNAQDSADTGPTDPSEIYFTGGTATTNGISFLNNVFVATGVGPGAKALNTTPTMGFTNNQVSTGTVTFFTAAEGATADFTLASGSMLIGKGGTGTGVPTNDIGFDPKCIVKQTPTLIGMIAKGSWWQYSVDVDYIKSLGGVAKCFNAKTRSGTPDQGAYANGAVTVSPAGACVAPSAGGAGGMPASCSAGMGGMDASAGGMAMTGAGTGGDVSPAGGAPTVGGAGGASTGVGGAVSNGGSANPGAGSPGAGSSGMPGGAGVAGSPSSMTGAGGAGGSVGGAAGAGTSPGAGGSSPGAGGTAPASEEKQAGGCGCRVAGDSSRGASLAGLGLLGLAVLGLGRRRRSF